MVDGFSTRRCRVTKKPDDETHGVRPKTEKTLSSGHLTTSHESIRSDTCVQSFSKAFKSVIVELVILIFTQSLKFKRFTFIECLIQFTINSNETCDHNKSLFYGST